MTERDIELLKTLSRPVRGLSVDQASAGFWSASPSGKREARRRLVLLSDRGLITFVRAYARTGLIDLTTGPLFSWEPGGEAPNAAALSYRSQVRQSGILYPVSSVVATRKGARLFGGLGGGFVRPFQASHDLVLGSVFLWFRRHAPKLSSRFVCEDVLPKGKKGEKGERVFDAAIESEFESGAAEVLIEVAGEYAPSEFERLHVEAVRRGLPYLVF